MVGMIGHTCTLKYPAMIQSVVLCDTSSRYPAAAASVWEDRIKTVTAKGMEPMVAGTLERWFTAPFRARRKDVMERIGGLIPSTPPPGYIGCCPPPPKIKVTDRLTGVRWPAPASVGHTSPAP